ncbi:MAG TPA: AsmA family protein, partial [Stellaceae bacterium]|nr:AsmA family protein [Stellaceae bacterium]
MRKTAIGLAILLFMALAGVLLAPQFVDLERYRPQIAERISNWSGRPVTLGGPISLSLLPSPHLSVQDLIIANVPSARTPEMVRVRRVDAAVSFLPLLAGRIEVTSARLVQPMFSLERLADGTDNWAFGKVTVAAPVGGIGAGGGPPPLPGTPRAEGLKVGGLTIKVASLSIEDGTVSYRSGDKIGTAEHISLGITGDAVSAPLRAEGTLTLLGTTLAVGVDVGRVGRAELPVSLTVASESLGSAEFAGTLQLRAAQPEAKGKLTLKSANPAALAALAGMETLPPVLAKATRVTGDLDATNGAIVLDHAAIEVGDIKADGSLRATLGPATAIGAKLTLNALDVDGILAERAATAPSGAGKGPAQQGSASPASGER